MPKKLKVLISAYACEPNKGSEPEVGWQWALQMARYHDVTVLTRSNNRAGIEKELANCFRMEKLLGVADGSSRLHGYLNPGQHGVFAHRYFRLSDSFPLYGLLCSRAVPSPLPDTVTENTSVFGQPIDTCSKGLKFYSSSQRLQLIFHQRSYLMQLGDGRTRRCCFYVEI